VNYTVNIAGDDYDIEAPDETTLKTAVNKLRLHVANDRSVERARAASEERQSRPARPAPAPVDSMGPGGDPRLQAADQINMQRATNATLAMAPVAGMALAAPAMAAGATALGMSEAAAPAVAGAVINGTPALLRGDLRRAALDAALGAAGAKTIGGLLKKALGRALPGAASRAPRIRDLISAETAASEAAASKAAGEVARRGMSSTGVSGAYVPPPNSIGSLILPTAPKAAPATAAGEKLGGEAIEDVAEKIIEWRTKHGFSGPQIVSALKDVYGIASKEGNEIARTVISSLTR
jgi:hypothetical protein